MYYIITYDVGEKRVNLVKKLLRTYLSWEQNSVLTGELSNLQITEIKDSLNKVVNKNEDHVMIFAIRSFKYIDRQDIGTPKSQMGEGGFFV